MMRVTKESDQEAPQKKRRRFGPREMEGMSALLGFASFLAESEGGRKIDFELAGPVHSAPSQDSRPTVSSATNLATETQTDPVDLLGYRVELSDCAFTQRLQQVLSSLHMPASLFIPAMLFHRSDSKPQEHKSGRAASHVAVASYIKTSLEMLS